MHRVNRKRALNYDAPINILLLAFDYAIFASVESVEIAGLATDNLGCVSYFAYLNRELNYGVLGNNQLILELGLKIR
jgi:hypothetical protein